MFLLAALLTAAAATTDPGLILQGASVYVSSDAKPQALTVLIRDGRIVFVGDSARARALAPSAKVVDLRGTFLFPGWADAHGHLAGLGRSLETANLRDATKPARRRRGWASSRALPPAHGPGTRVGPEPLADAEVSPTRGTLIGRMPERPAAAGAWTRTRALVELGCAEGCGRSTRIRRIRRAAASCGALTARPPAS